MSEGTYISASQVTLKFSCSHRPCTASVAGDGTTFHNTPATYNRLTFVVEYAEQCGMWANESLGLQIPLPGEVTV